MITIVDYGMGNLRSVSKALEYLGAEVRVSSSPQDIESASKLVLPGVGAFKDAVEELKSRDLFDRIKSHIQNERPFLGICLGLQLLFTESEESPGVEGLDVLSGKVRKLKAENVKIPHMGWNQVDITKGHPLLENVLEASFFYFVHSFQAAPQNLDVLAGACEYGGEKVTAIVAERNIVATQFHPEKSQGAGLQILKNFISWSL